MKNIPACSISLIVNSYCLNRPYIYFFEKGPNTDPNLMGSIRITPNRPKVHHGVHQIITTTFTTLL